MSEISFEDENNTIQEPDEEMLRIIEEDNERTKQLGFIGLSFLEFINNESGEISNEKKLYLLRAWAVFGARLLSNNFGDIKTLGNKNTSVTFKKLIEFIKKHTTMNVSDINEDALKELLEDNQEVMQLINDIEPLKSLLPEKHVKPNNKLANEITRDFVNQGEIELRVNRNGSKREVVTKAMLSYDDENVSLSGRAKFTPYDREVHDAVVTLYTTGNEVVTPEMVYRAMNGMTDTEKLSPQAIGSVTRSLDKSMRIMVKIDFSQEAKVYKKDCKATYEGYLLACEKITVSAGGTTKEAYKLLRKPILYDYAQVTSQIISVPIKLLQTKEAVRGTEDVIVIRGYLLRQIEGMKSRTFKRSNKITFQGIFDELGITPETFSNYKDKTKKTRNNTEAILGEWKECGYIKNYEQYKEGKTIKGIIIKL